MRTFLVITLSALGLWLIISSFKIGRQGDEYIQQGMNMLQRADQMKAELERGQHEI